MNELNENKEKINNLVIYEYEEKVSAEKHEELIR
jgi:hypothetical protein